MFKQDDPKKCTAAKLVKFGLAHDSKKTTNQSLILDPFVDETLLPHDKSNITSIVGIDCSWHFADQMFLQKFVGIKRKLPPLFAGNPVNYAKLNKLTTVEAISAALLILGYNDQAHKLLNKFTWGHTFLELNHNLFSEYSKLECESQIESVLQDYGLLRD